MKKILSVVASLAILANSLVYPFVYAYAQEETSTPEPTPIIEEIVTPSPEPTIEPTATPSFEPTSSPEADQPLAETPSPSPWTFEKVELNKEYIAPQNSEVKLTFTKLPDPSGNIKIEEITLTEDQIKQTGSLSDKAYDITSDMKDGDFTYNLSLPIPESSKGKSIEVKFAEEISKIDSAEKVENSLTKTDTSVSVASLDHFTTFFVVISGTITSPGPDTYVGEPFDETPSLVIINEFLFNPSSGNEWVELFNKTGSDINLENWQLVDDNDVSNDLILTGTLPANGILAFEKSGGDSWLNNTGSESITLKDNNTQIQDIVSYKDNSSFVNGQNIGNAGENQSVCRTEDAGNTWQVCSSPTKGWFNDAGQLDKAPLLSTIQDSLLADAEIDSNIGELDNPSNTPSGDGGLYFEKLNKGKIVFTTSLNLSDQNTVTILQSLGTAMEMSDGHIKFDSQTATDMAATGAKIYMYGLSDFNAMPNLIVKNDADTVIQLGTDDYPTIVKTWDNDTKTLTFTTSHFTQFDIEYPVTNETTSVKYATIQAAITAATSGDTINVGAGTYDEQVVINKNLTLQGAGDTTIIRPSSRSILTSTYTHPSGTFWPGSVMSGILLVKNSTAVIIKDLKVDGVNITSLPTTTPANDRLSGVLFGESSGTIDNVTVNNIKTTGYANRTYGIEASGASTGTYSVEVKNSHVNDWARNGIVADGLNLTANINHNTLVGPNTISGQVANGILFIGGVTGNATLNTISGMHYNAGTSRTAGILVFGSTTAGILIDQNNISDTDDGIDLSNNSHNATVSNNNIHNNLEVGIQLEDGTANNTITDNTIADNTMAGIRFGGAGDPIPAEADTPPGAGNVANYKNTITGNAKGVVNYDTGLNQTFDATNNWWGSSDPTVIQAGISGSVTFRPYYTNSGKTILSPTAPGTPTTVSTSPTNNTTPTWSWSPSIDANHYILYWSTTLGGTTFNSGNISGTSYIHANPLTDAIWYTKVKAYDLGNNPSAFSGNSDALTVDTTAPVLSSVSISSNNTTTTLAKVGDIVTLHFFSSEPVKPPTIYIAGHQISEDDISNNLPDNGNEWFAHYQMAGGDSEGQISFSIAYVDAVDNAGSTVTAITNGLNVVFDKTTPTVTKLGNDSADATLSAGATNLVFSEDLSASSTTAVQNALTDGADKVLTYSWTGGTLVITTSETTTFVNDVVANISDIAGNVTNNELLIDSQLASGQISPSTGEDGNGTATADSETPEIVITDPDQEVTVTVTGSTEATIDVSSFITDGEGDIPQININSDTADIEIPATTVTGPTGWDGIIAAPTITTIDLPVVSGETSTLGTAIEIGFATDKLSFDNAVRILLPGQAGKKAGYSRPGTDFTEITTICGEDSQTWADGNLGADSECKIDVGLDLVIWTKHFTKFAAYTQTTNSTSGSNSSSTLSTASAPVCNDTKPGSAPSGLTAVAGFNSVTLSWNKASDPVSYYLITYGTSSGSQTYGNPNIGGASTTSYTITNLSGGIKYYFKVRAGNGCAPGDYSNEASTTPSGGFVEGVAPGFEAGVLGESTEQDLDSTSTATAKPTSTPEVKGTDTKDWNARNIALISFGSALAILALLLLWRKNKK